MSTAEREARKRELESLLEQYRTIENDAQALVAGSSGAQLNWSPDARWSVAQCVEHLTRTVRLYPEAIARMIEEARAREAAGRPPYRESWISRWIVRDMEPPAKHRIRTMAAVEPPRELSRERVLSDFTAAYRELAELARAAYQVDPGRARMRSPFARLFRFTLRQVLHMNAAHARRHLWQARQVRAQPGFPVC